MKANGPSESYQNQNLKAMIVFANYLGPINFLLLLCLHPERPVLLIFFSHLLAYTFIYQTMAKV
jgi:hypothetical protein